MITKTTVSRRILNYLAETNSTKSQLAEKLEVSPALITYWINAERSPSLEMLNRLETAIGKLEGEFYSNAPYWLAFNPDLNFIELITTRGKTKPEIWIEYPNEKAMLETAAYDYIRCIYSGKDNKAEKKIPVISSTKDFLYDLNEICMRILYLTEGKMPDIPLTQEEIEIFNFKPRANRFQRPGFKRIGDM